MLRLHALRLALHPTRFCAAGLGTSCLGATGFRTAGLQAMTLDVRLFVGVETLVLTF